jgi:hypothetical protein
MNNTSTQLDSFETALLTELRREVVEHPAVPSLSPSPMRRPRRRRRLAAAGATAVAASVVAVFGLGGSGGSPAYAVAEDGDGDVTVTIHQLDDATGLEQALAAHGIDADVSYDPQQSGTTAMLNSNGPGGAVPPPPGSAPSGGGLTQHKQEGGGPVTSGPGSAAGADDPCGPIDPAPARLRHLGDDWVLSIPAGSPLQDRHVEIGTGPDGTLSVEYAGNEPGSICGIMQMDAPAPGTR